jgi:hypothetical protein
MGKGGKVFAARHEHEKIEHFTGRKAEICCNSLVPVFSSSSATCVEHISKKFFDNYKKVFTSYAAFNFASARHFCCSSMRRGRKRSKTRVRENRQRKKERKEEGKKVHFYSSCFSFSLTITTTEMFQRCI